MPKWTHKPVIFVGTSKKDISAFPPIAKFEVGVELWEIQCGREASDWKPMPSIGKGVSEIRIRVEDGQFRVIYVAKFKEAIYALHAFQKKTQKTEKHDLELAKQRLAQVQTSRGT